MPADPVKERIAELSRQIGQCDHEYYVLNTPSLKDSEYDRLFDELRSLEQKHPEHILSDSPSKRVGSDLSNDFPEVTHTIPVLSLDKAYTPEDLRAWITRCSKGLNKPFNLLVEEKMDGSSLVLYYELGVLTRALTRGNGEWGNDITPNVRTIRSVPLRLKEPRNAAIRGEVYMTIDDFERVRSQSSVDYANPRNFASGSLRRIKSSEVARIPLRFFAYEPFGEGFTESHSENMKQLRELGLSVNPHQKLFEIDPGNDRLLNTALSEMEKFIADTAEHRSALDYEIDGMVIKIDESAIREQLGYTGHHPRWAIAYKFESPQGITRVQSIDIQIGRTGRITPVARVEPVLVSGTTIRNVTLHNQDYIDSLNLAPGDSVAVSRRGDVIPAIEQVIEKGSQPIWRIPETCPCCSSTLERQGAHHFCVNFDCPDRKRGRIIFFTGRDQMDIENLGSETVITLMDEGIIQDIPDIFRLDYERIATLPGFGEKKVELIRKGVEKASRQSYRRIVVSLGISDFGPKLAELLEDSGYRSIDSLFSIMDDGKETQLADIKGVGEKTVATISRQMKEPRFRTMIDELKSLGLQFTAPEKEESTLPQIFAGQRWCVTGSFEHFKPRSLAMEEIKKRGGQGVSDVSSKSTHLLAGTSAGSKLEKARQLELVIVDENEFLRLLKQ